MAQTPALTAGHLPAFLGNSNKTNIMWWRASSTKKYAIHWFVSKAVQCLGSKSRLVHLYPFKIYFYTFSLPSLLYAFQLLPGPALNAWAQAMCNVMQPRARVWQGQPMLCFLSQRDTRPADGLCQTLKGQSISVIITEILCFQNQTKR